MNIKSKLFYLIVSALIAGCINYEQKAILNEDGSGSMKVHYWSKMRNLEMGTTLGKFEFIESKARNKYDSNNNEVTSILIENDLTDSTTHVNIELTFKDINKINDATSFSTTRAIWKKNSDNLEFKYVVLKDTGASKQMNSETFKITFEFTLPSEIISTNGTMNGQTVKFSYTLADLVNDLEMTAIVKKPLNDN